MSSPTEKISVRTGRTRTGCLICRSRRVKCDEVKPTCRRCQRYGAECSYPAKKTYDQEEIASALARRHLKKSRTDQPVSTASPSDLTLHQDDDNIQAGPSRLPINDEREPLDLLIALGRSTRMGAFYIDSTAPPEFLKLAFPVEDDLKCIHHCITYSLSILIVEENANPWVEHVAPLFLFPTNEAPVAVAALRSAMLALGATHLSYLQKKSLSDDWMRTRQLASHYFDDATHACRAGRSISEELASDTFLAACTVMLTVCVFAAEKGWKEVWRYTLAAIAYRGGCSAILDRLGSVQRTPLLRCIVEQLAVTDLFAALGTGTCPIILGHSSEWWERLEDLNRSFEASRSVESRFGMDRRLIRYLATLADCVMQRIRLQQHTGSWLGLQSDGQVARERRDLEIQTQSIKLELETWHSETSSIDKDSRTRIGSLAFWHACHILIHRDIEQGMWTAETLMSHASAVVELCIHSSDKIEYLNWPLLIASSVMQKIDERDRVRQLFRVFAYQCCYEIEVLSRIIEAMWEPMDQGRDDEATSWREVMVEIGWPVLLG